MSGFPILDLVIGMIFIFFMLSIISSSLVEIIISYFRLRSKVLEKWLFNIFDKETVQPDGTSIKLGNAIMDHCLTTALAKAGKATSYIDSKNFVSALLEKMSFNKEEPTFIAQNLDDLIVSIKSAKASDGSSLLSTELQRTLLAYAYEARAAYTAMEHKTIDEVHLFRKKMEAWYDSSMDRVEGHLKRKYARPITFWVGVLVVLGLNADSIAISRYLYSNPDVRAKLAAQAYTTAKDTAIQARVRALVVKSGNSDSLSQQAILEDIEEKQLELKKNAVKLEEYIPLGWKLADLQKLRQYPKTAFPKLAGWMATVLAIMLGAPFWFDLLNKVANLRGSGPRPASTADKDRRITGDKT